MFVLARVNSSYDYKVYKKMSDEDVKNFIFLNEKIKEIENMSYVKNIAQKNNQNFLDFIKEKINGLNDKTKGRAHFKFDEYHEEGLDLILKSILLSRTIIENIRVDVEKSFDKGDNNLKKFKSMIKNKDLEIMRYLRNFSFHYTLPISTSSIRYDILKGQYNGFNFYSYKADLIEKNFFRKHESKFINQTVDDKLVYNDYIPKWMNLINQMYEFYIEYKSKSISSEFKNFHKNYNDFITIDQVHVMDVNPNGTYTKYVIDKDIYNLLVKVLIKK
ncbi:hypothetical protein NSA42_03040 [Paeniclostridium sordellii]|uniref:hypothetical protein n=1 Tax=Paraclostridium sordellii TaxID=1505 RepID=UPI002149D5FD|nr:hypothetical protein [Paeniclostridium sordellii]MCR1848244.1 hypothetical protein [Paeniclostridium sordellii]